MPITLQDGALPESLKTEVSFAVFNKVQECLKPQEEPKVEPKVWGRAGRPLRDRVFFFA